MFDAQSPPTPLRRGPVRQTDDQALPGCEMLAEVLDALRAGMFLVTSLGSIRHANVSGRAMLREGALLGLTGGRLVANDVNADEKLCKAFALAGTCHEGLRGRSVGVPAIGRDGLRYVMHVTPLTSGPRLPAVTSCDAVAALFVLRAELPAVSSVEAITSAYGLTIAELRVMMTIVEVGSVAETAKKLGIAGSTVRTHLHRLFGKTGAERQSDLVKIVAGFSNPVL